MLEMLSADDFTKHINDISKLKLDQLAAGSELDSLNLTLFAVSLLNSGEVEKGKRKPFSVLFKGPAEPVLPQKIYTLEHQAMNTLSLFLVPLGPRDDGMVHEAVFT